MFGLSDRTIKKVCDNRFDKYEESTPQKRNFTEFINSKVKNQSRYDLKKILGTGEGI